MRLIKSLILIALTVLTSNATAQFGERSRLGCINGTQSIIRTGSTIYYYVYTENSTPHGSFSKVERSSNLTLATINLDSGYLVTDFMMYNGRIYFTGNYNGGTGYIGWFNADSVFNGNGTIHYCRFKKFSILPNNILFRDFRRIKVFSDGINIHTLVLGLRISLSPTRLDHCIMDYIIGSSSFTYAYNNEFSEYFDDIAITGSTAITASRKGANITGPVYMRKFPLTSFSLSNLIGKSIYYPNNECISEVHLQPASSSSDTFFAVYYSEKYNDNTLMFQGLRINRYQVLTSGIAACGSSLIVNNQGSTLSANCKIRETAYNTRWRRLLVLQDMDTPISTSTTISAVCSFLHTGSAMSFDRAVYWNGIPYNSMSMYNMHCWMACKVQNNMVNVLIENCTNTSSYSCATHNTSLLTTSETLQIETTPYELTTGTHQVIRKTSSPVVIPSIYIEDCIHSM